MAALTDADFSSAEYQFLYKTLFKGGGIAQRDIEYVDMCDAVAAIAADGGLPVLAHPGQFDNYEALPALVDAGLVGIEKYHPDHDYRDTQLCGRVGRTLQPVLHGWFRLPRTLWQGAVSWLPLHSGPGVLGWEYRDRYQIPSAIAHKKRGPFAMWFASGALLLCVMDKWEADARPFYRPRPPMLWEALLQHVGGVGGIAGIVRWDSAVECHRCGHRRAAER